MRLYVHDDQTGAGVHFSQGYFMKTTIKPGAVYVASGNVVVRQVDDQIILIPLPSGIEDTGNAPFILNMTGQEIWRRLDGKKSLKNISSDLAVEFNLSSGAIQKDVIGFVSQLLKMKMLVCVSGS